MTAQSRATLKDYFNTGETITEADMADLIDSFALETGTSDIAALTAASALDGTELFYGVQGGNDRKVTGTQIKTLAQTGVVLTAGLASAVATLDATDAALDARLDTLEASGGTNPLTTYSQVDDFTSGSATSGSVGELGWNTSGGTVTLMDGEAEHHGIVRRETSATSGTLAYTTLRGTPATGIILPSAMFEIKVISRLNTNDANTTSRFGLMNSAASATPTGGIYIEKLDADTNWFAVCRSGAVQTRTDMGVAVGTGWFTRIIRRIDASTIGFRIGATSALAAAATEITITSNIPTAAMNLGHQITNSAAANKTMDLDYVSFVITGISR